MTRKENEWIDEVEKNRMAEGIEAEIVSRQRNN